MNSDLSRPIEGRGGRGTTLVGAALAIMVACASSPAFAADVFFTNGAADNNWDNATNWDTNTLPTVGDNAHVNLGFAGLPGTGANITGALTNPQVDRIIVGDAGTGVLTQTAGSLMASVDTFIGTGAGNVGEYYIYGGSFTTGGSMYVGQSGAYGLYDQSGTGFTDVNSNLIVGSAGGVGTYNLSGTGSTAVANNLIVGDGFGSVGTLNQSAGSAMIQGDFVVGNAGGTGTYNLSGTGTASANNLLVGDGFGSSGTANIMHTSLMTVAADLVVGSNGGAGVLNQQDSPNVEVFGSLIVGAGSGSAGTYNMSGGTVKVGSDMIVGNGTGSGGVVNVTGGKLTINGDLDLSVNIGLGTLNQAGGFVTVVGDLNTGTSPGFGVYNLTGGTLYVGGNVNGNSGGTGGFIGFTGGTLTAAGTLDFTQDGPTTLLDVTGTLAGNDTEILVAYDLGAGTASINGGNTLKVSGAINNLAGPGVINVGTTTSGTLIVTGTADIDTLNLRNGTVTSAGLTVGNATATGTNVPSTINGPVTLASGGVINVSDGSLTLTGTLNTSNGTIGGGTLLAHTLNATGGFSVAAGGTTTKNGPGTTNIAGAQSHGVGAVLTTIGGMTNLDSDANGNLTVNANSIAGTNFGSTMHLEALTVGVAARAKITSGGAKVLVTNGVGPITGKLDVTDNDMIVHATAATKAAVLDSLQNPATGFIATGSLGLTWTGNGINSSTAANDPNLLTAVGVMLNDDGFGGPFYTSFSGQPVDAHSILVKYTYYGDADLSGSVDGTDYALIDNGFNNGQSGWFNGDFDYSGAIDGTDYALIDNAFNAQGGPLGSLGPIGPAVPEPGSAVLLLLAAVTLIGARGVKHRATSKAA